MSSLLFQFVLFLQDRKVCLAKKAWKFPVRMQGSNSNRQEYAKVEICLDIMYTAYQKEVNLPAT